MACAVSKTLTSQTWNIPKSLVCAIMYKTMTYFRLTQIQQKKKNYDDLQIYFKINSQPITSPFAVPSNTAFTNTSSLFAEMVNFSLLAHLHKLSTVT